MREPLPAGFLDLVKMFCELKEAFDPPPGIAGGSASSLRDFAKQHSTSVANISQRLRRLEKLLGSEGRPCQLLRRKAGVGIEGFTDAGEKFYNEAHDLLDRVESIIPSSTARVSSRPAQVSIGSTYFLLSHFFPWIMSGRRLESNAEARQAKFVFRTGEYFDLLSLVESGEVDFALGPALSPREKKERRQLLFRDLAPKFEMAAVFSPQHDFALPWTEAGKTPRKDTEERGRQRFELRRNPSAEMLPLQLKQLTDQHLLVVPEHVQPRLARPVPETDPGKGGRRMIVPHYDAILAFIQASARTAVGIVPCWRLGLDELCRAGRISYARLPELGHIQLSLYLPRRSLSGAATAVVDAIEAEASTLAAVEGTVNATPMSQMPHDLNSYRYGYHVSRDGEGRSEWRRSKLNLKVGNDEGICGQLTDFYDNRSKEYGEEYKVKGCWYDSLITYTASPTKLSAMSSDTFTECFQIHLCLPEGASSRNERRHRQGNREPAGVLLGSWNGKDDGGTPVVGCTILATEVLGPKEINYLLAKFGGTWFQNAQREPEEVMEWAGEFSYSVLKSLMPSG